MNIVLIDSELPAHARVLRQSDAQVMSLPEASGPLAARHVVGQPRCRQSFLVHLTEAEGEMLEILHRQTAVGLHSSSLPGVQVLCQVYVYVFFLLGSEDSVCLRTADLFHVLAFWVHGEVAI